MGLNLNILHKKNRDLKQSYSVYILILNVLSRDAYGKSAEDSSIVGDPRPVGKGCSYLIKNITVLASWEISFN